MEGLIHFLKRGVAVGRRELSTWVLPGRDSGLARGDTEPSALWQPNAVRQPFTRNVRKVGPSRKDLPASANLRIL